MTSAQEFSPLYLQKRLYNKFSSSQTYFYTNTINEIIKEKRTSVNIFYEDIEYVLDLQENFKRWYYERQFSSKMFTFKEYYFYHQDCPRIFMKDIEDVYAKWQDKKRDVVYKKLKILYKESYSSDLDSAVEEQKSKNYVGTTHFLLQISEYNPFSKKYYLRVEARKEKEKLKLEEEKRNKSKRDIEFLNHQLSAMLQDMSILSQISTLSQNSPLHPEKERLKPKIRTYLKDNSQQKSKSNSTSLTNSNSIITFNFKKNKGSIQKLRSIKQPKKLLIKDPSKEREHIVLDADRNSPKFQSNPGDNQFLKSKSIFSVSTFGAINKQTDLHNTLNKKDAFKLNFESKKLTLDEHPKYFTEKKKESLPKNIVVKTKSTSKFEPRGSIEKIKSRQGSVGRLPHADEFTDKKINGNNNVETRIRSLKSEFISGSKRGLINIRPSLQRMHQTNLVEKGRRLLELKNW